MIRKIPLFYPQLICKRITQRFISHVKVGKVSSEYYQEANRTLVFVVSPRVCSRLQRTGPFGVNLLAGLFLILESRTE